MNRFLHLVRTAESTPLLSNWKIKMALLSAGFMLLFGSINAQTYCVPSSFYGCTDGDVIARVILNSLDNNSGTGCPGGSSGYSDYTNNPLLTTTLMPSSTYSCVVYAGQYSEGYAAWIDYNDDGVFDSSERIGYSNGQVSGSGISGVLGSSASFPISISCSPLSGQHRLRVRAMYATNGISVDPCASNYYGEVEDYTITIGAAPACPSPGSIAVSGVTLTSATLTWSMGCSTATNFDFEYGPVGFTPGTGTLLTNQLATISGSTGSYIISGLNAGTAYDVYYRANCGGSVSAWSTSAMMFTGYCLPNSTASSYSIGGVSATSILGSFNQPSGFGSNGYSDYSSTVGISAFAGNNINLTVTSGNSGYYYFSKVWVDWNNDLDFADAGELMYSTPYYYYNDTYSATLSVPAGTAVGNYRMRVRSDYGSAYYNGVLDACGSISYGEAEDYTLTVAPLPPLPAISNVSPIQACPRAEVTITGTDFIAVSDVSFGTTSAEYTVVSPTQITAIVPTGLTPGLNSLNVTTISGTGVFGVLTYPDANTSISGTLGLCANAPASLNASGSGSFVWNYSAPCTYSIRLNDTYGDGWNGGQIDVLVDGIVVLDNITLASGAGPLYFDFAVYANSEITINYVTPSQFPTEMNYTMFSGAQGGGSVVYASTVYSPVPTTVSQVATLCGNSPMQSTEIGSSAAIQGTSAGLYQVEFTDANGCQATDAVVVEEHPVPSVVTPAALSVCLGGATIITATEASNLPDMTYTWLDAGGNVVGTGADFNTASLTTSGYYFTIGQTPYCVSATVYTDVLVSPISGVQLTPINTSCYGSADGSFTQTELCGTAPFTYSVVAPGQNAGVFTPLPNNLVAGTYQVYVKDANGNVSLPVPLTIASPAPITATVTTVGDNICSGLTEGYVSGTVSNGSTGGSFGTNMPSPGVLTLAGSVNVNVPAGSTILGATLLITNATASNGSWMSEMRVSLGGAITIAPTQISTNIGGGTVASYSIAIPAASVSNGTVDLYLSESYDDYNVTDATFGDVTLTVNYTNPQTIMWFANAQATSYLGLGSSIDLIGTALIPSPGTSGIYTAYAAYTDGMCVGPTTPVTLTISGLSGVALTSVDLTCFESNDGSFTQTEACGVAPFTYSVVAPGAAASAYSALPTNLAAGTYDVYIHDANGEAAGPISLTVSQPAQLPTTVTTDATACVGVPEAIVSASSLFPAQLSFSSGSLNLPVISYGGAVNAPITVAGIPAGAVVTGIDVTLNMTHTFDSDVVLSLTSPDGTTIDLSSNNGSSGDNYTNTVFSSAASSSITSGSAPFTGTFLPEGDFSTLYSNTNGTWTLSAIDNVGGDDGNLQNWSVTIHYQQSGTVIWWADANATQFLGLGSDLNLVGTSVLPTATQGIYTVYASSFDGVCHGPLVPATLAVGQPLTPTISADVVAQQNIYFLSNYDMSGIGFTSQTFPLNLPNGAIVTSSILHVNNVTLDGFTTDADLTVSLSGAATLAQTSLGTTYGNVYGQNYDFTAAVVGNGDVMLTLSNGNSWWGDLVSFGEVTLEVNYLAPTPQVVCPDAELLLAVTTTGGGGPQTYQWFNNGVPISGETGTTYSVTVVQGDSYSVEVTDDCNANVSSEAFTPVYASLNTVSISGPSTVLINDITSATPGSDVFTIVGETTNTTIDWFYSDNPFGPWSSLVMNGGDSLTIDFTGANGVYYFQADVTYPAGCTSTTAPIAVQVANAIDMPCFAAELTLGDQNGFVWTTASSTVDTNEVAPPADGCNVQTGWCDSNLDATVWFKFVAPASGHVGIQAPGFDDQLAVYAVENCSDYSTFTLINANDDDGTGVGQGTSFSALLSDVKCLTPGQTYYVQLDAFTGTGSTTMLLVDLGNQAPTIDYAPSDITITNDTDQCGAVVVWDLPQFTDDQGCFSVSNNFNSGDIFPIGTTQVAYYAVDTQGDSTLVSFNVTVQDTQAPSMVCFNDTTIMVGLNECAISSSDLAMPVAADNCEIQSLTMDLPAVMGYGVYLATYVATDIHGNQTTCTRTITVIENPNTVWPTTLTVDGDGTFCEGGLLGIHAAEGNYTYEWYFNGSLLNGVNTATIEATLGGVYSCVLTNTFGCSTTTNEVAVTSLPNSTYFLDADADTYGAGVGLITCTAPPAGYVLIDGDCNDADASINPGATEILDNNIDENCDGVIGIGVTEISASVLSAYPNPTSGMLTLNLSSDLIGENYVIYDGVGKVVMKGRVVALNQTLEMGALSAGTYMLSIRESHVRVVVQH